jgi:hypothetical protein
MSEINNFKEEIREDFKHFVKKVDFLEKKERLPKQFKKSKVVSSVQKNDSLSYKSVFGNKRKHVSHIFTQK